MHSQSSAASATAAGCRWSPTRTAPRRPQADRDLINRPDLPPGDTRNADDSASFEAMLDPVVIDHVIYAHPDLDAAVAYLANRFGVLATGGGRHPARGTHNKLLALGARTYLEVIAPDPDQPEPDEPRPYGVEGISRGGLVGWALAVDDIDAAVANARQWASIPVACSTVTELTRQGRC